MAHMETVYLQLALFALAASITPGPNNLMLMASGASFGLRRSLPHWTGVVIGFVLLIVVTGLGLGALILENPTVRLGFRLGCIVILLWLGWRIATAKRPGEVENSRRPLTFLQAGAFQWVNPKGWAMALSAISLYAESSALADVLTVAAIFALVNMPSTGLWLLSGERIQRLLRKDAHFRAFNMVMGVLLAACAVPILFEI